MTPPKIVSNWAQMDWVSIDDQVWFSGEIRRSVVGVGGSKALGVHNDPLTGEQCRNTPAHISDHTIVSVEPLTISPSLACNACSWHGFVRDGHWVPA